MTPRRIAHLAAAAAALAAVTACSSDRQAPLTAAPARSGPTSTASAPPNTSTGGTRSAPSDPGHVVVVVMENKPYRAVVGNASAPYLNTLARTGMSFTSLHAIRHPSQPNYVALFSGSTHGVVDDSCPQHLTGPNLAQELHRAGLTFAGFSEGLPAVGSGVCSIGGYARKHAPWTDFANVSTSVGKPFTAFPRDFATLPTVSFVVPNLNHDMHDGTIAEADTWTRSHLSAYVTWARTHHSLLVVTWDEDDHSAANRIPTFVVGADVARRSVATPLTLYSVLRAVEDRYGLPRLGGAATAPSLGPVAPR